MKELRPSWHFKIVWKDKIALIIKYKLLTTLTPTIFNRVVSNLCFMIKAILSFHTILKCQLDPSSFMVLLEVWVPELSFCIFGGIWMAFSHYSINWRDLLRKIKIISVFKRCYNIGAGASSSMSWRYVSRPVTVSYAGMAFPSHLNITFYHTTIN